MYIFLFHDPIIMLVSLVLRRIWVTVLTVALRSGPFLLVLLPLGPLKFGSKAPHEYLEVIYLSLI